MIMRIRGYDMDIAIEENQNALLCIVNKKLYRKVIADMEGLIDGEDDNEIVIEDDDALLDYDKDVVCISDYFHLDCNNRQLLTLLDKKAEKMIVQDLDNNLEFEVLYKKLTHELQKVLLDLEMDIEYRSDFDIDEFLKMVDLRFARGNTKNVLEQLYGYLDVISCLRSVKLIVLVNLRANFSMDEISLIFKYMSYKKMKWICIEGTDCDMIDAEKKYLIDEDLVEFPYSK